jgi:hypothetical protein
MEKWNIGFWDNGILVHGKIRVDDILKYNKIWIISSHKPTLQCSTIPLFHS